MAECVYCKTETELYENGRPICVRCSAAKAVNPRLSFADPRIRLNLFDDVRKATDRVNAVAESFTSIIKDIPSDVPQPDGALRIAQASRELAAAREEMMLAHRRLNDFLSRGVIPDNLKVS